MADNDEEAQAQDQHKVGYGAPPVEHRFPPGRSGNPKGRPKGSKGYRAELKEVMEEKLKVNGKRVSARKANLLAMRKKAIVDGNARSQSDFDARAQILDAEDAARAAANRSAEVEENDKRLIEAALARLLPRTP